MRQRPSVCCSTGLRSVCPARRRLCPYCQIEDCIVDWDDDLPSAVRACPPGLGGQYELTPSVKYRLGTALIKMAVSRRRVKIEIEEPEPRLIRHCGLMAGSADLALGDMVPLDTSIESLRITSRPQPGISSERSGPSAVAGPVLPKCTQTDASRDYRTTTTSV